jgi:hypothetical protein
MRPYLLFKQKISKMIIGFIEFIRFKGFIFHPEPACLPRLRRWSKVRRDDIKSNHILNLSQLRRDEERNLTNITL